MGAAPSSCGGGGLGCGDKPGSFMPALVALGMRCWGGRLCASQGSPWNPLGIGKNNSLLLAGLQSRQKKLISEDSPPSTNYSCTGPPAWTSNTPALIISPSYPAVSPELFLGMQAWACAGLWFLPPRASPASLTFRSRAPAAAAHLQGLRCLPLWQGVCL